MVINIEIKNVEIVMEEGVINYLQRTKYHPAIYVGIDEVMRHSDGTQITSQELRICEYHYWIQKVK